MQQQHPIIRSAVILFLAGAIFGNICNSFHAFSGTIPVTSEHFNPLLDWSSYVLFGFAGVFVGLVTLGCDKWLRKSVPPVAWPNAISACALLGIFYFLSACMFLSNMVILWLLITGFILLVVLYDRNPVTVLAALLVAIAGTTVEITLVHYKVYYYSRPQLMGVTYWLPFLYGIASVATGQLARAL